MKLMTIDAATVTRCQRCGGNAYLETIDEPELRCLQCGRLIARLEPNLQAPGRVLPTAA